MIRRAISKSSHNSLRDLKTRSQTSPDRDTSRYRAHSFQIRADKAIISFLLSMQDICACHAHAHAHALRNWELGKCACTHAPSQKGKVKVCGKAERALRELAHHLVEVPSPSSTRVMYPFVGTSAAIQPEALCFPSPHQRYLLTLPARK